MKRLTTIMILSLAALGAVGCGKSPEEQCEAVYKKGDGEKAYSTDKAKFMAACTKTSDLARKCLGESGKQRFDDKDCGPDSKAWDEVMQVMKIGQGTP